MTTSKPQIPTSASSTTGGLSTSQVSANLPRADVDDLRQLIKDMAVQIGSRLNDLEGRALVTPVPPPTAGVEPTQQYIAPSYVSAGPLAPALPAYVAPIVARGVPPVVEVADGWDAQSVEALTQLYERDVPAQSMRGVRGQPEVFYVEGATSQLVTPAIERGLQSVAASVSTLVQATPTGTTQSLVGDNNEQQFGSLLQRLSEDRVWLDGRLAEIAARVDANIEQGSSVEGLDVLNARLVSLEDRLTPVLGSLVTRADIADMADMASITAIERQLDGLSSAVAETRRDLARLDAIEAALQDLASYAADARAMDAMPADQSVDAQSALGLIDQNAAAADAAQMEAFAEATALRVTQQIAQMKPEATDRIAHLHDIVAEMIADRRKNDEQVASTLDTLQDALVRLIERVEGYEDQGFDGPAVDDVPVYQAPQTAAPVQAAPIAQPTFVAEARPTVQASFAAPQSMMQSAPSEPESDVPTISAAEALAQARRQVREGRFVDDTVTPSEPEFVPPPIEPQVAQPIYSKAAGVQPRQDNPQRAKPAAARPVPSQPQQHDFEDLAQRSRVGRSPRGGVKISTVTEDDLQVPADADTAPSTPRGPLSMRKRPVVQVVAAAVTCMVLSYFAYLFLADRMNPYANVMQTDGPRAAVSLPTPREPAPQPTPVLPTPVLQTQPMAPQAPVKAGMEPPGLQPLRTEERAVPVAVQPGFVPQPMAPVVPRDVTPLQQALPPPVQVQPGPRQQPLPRAPDQRVPQAQPVSPSVAPAAPLPGRPRSQPETVTDDLSDGSNVVDPGASRIATSTIVPKRAMAPAHDESVVPVQMSAPHGVPGVAIQTSPMRVEDLFAAQQRRALAARSQSAAERVFDAAPAPVQMQPRGQPMVMPVAPTPVAAPVTPVKAQPDARLRGEDMLPVGTPSAGIITMPPAGIGPTSLRTAAASGDPASQFEVAARFAEGRGVKQDFRQAHDWYQRASAKGHVPSQYRLGTLYERGLGVAVDLGRAKAWYKRAAEQGNVKAMHNLAVLSANTEGQSPDYAVASQWFLEAAYRGLADSQFNLAVLHENGLGVKKDSLEAAKWYALSAKSGDPEAIKRRDMARAKLSAQDNVRLEASLTGFKRKPVDQKANEAKVAGLVSVTPRR